MQFCCNAGICQGSARLTTLLNACVTGSQILSIPCGEPRVWQKVGILPQLAKPVGACALRDSVFIMGSSVSRMEAGPDPLGERPAGSLASPNVAAVDVSFASHGRLDLRLALESNVQQVQFSFLHAAVASDRAVMTDQMRTARVSSNVSVEFMSSGRLSAVKT